MVIEMIKKSAMLCLLALTLAGMVRAQERDVPKGIPHLDHVWVIMMENHGFNQLFKNPNAPFINKFAKSSNTAMNYFAVGHPSLTNYLEVTGGSNFGVRNDNSPDWHNQGCTANIVSGIPSLEGAANICPITGSGSDARLLGDRVPGESARRARDSGSGPAQASVPRTIVASASRTRRARPVSNL